MSIYPAGTLKASPQASATWTCKIHTLPTQFGFYEQRGPSSVLKAYPEPDLDPFHNPPLKPILNIPLQ